MSDPTRLIDEVGGDELEGSLLRLARNESPSADSRRRILAGIAAVGVTSLAANTAQAVATSNRSLTLVKWGVAAAVAVVIPAAVLLRGSDEPVQVKPAPTTLQAPSADMKATPLSAPDTGAPAPLALEDLPALPNPAPASGSPAGRQQQGSLADEVAQLQKAKLALKAGSPAQALGELATYAQRFPRPMLGTEASVLRIEALSQNGDAAHAKSLAAAFLAKNPNSPYAARLRSLTGAQ